MPQEIIKKFENGIRTCLESLEIRSVVIGISGGADSVALLLSLTNCGLERITAVHCNFHLRGGESDRDRTFVENLCNRLNIKCEIIDIKTTEYVHRNKVSVEMACRETRYAEFRKIQKETGADRILVAHNSDDQAETLLLNLMRGCGVSGLRGMLKDTGEIMRPLINTSRQTILEYLKAKGQDYMTDSTNLESNYRRNFLRNEVIPLLESRWPHAKKALCRTAENLASEEMILNDLEDYYLNDQSMRLAYNNLTSIIKGKWLVRRFAKRFGASEPQSREIWESIEANEFQSGKKWILPNGIITAEREYLEYRENSKETGFVLKSERFDNTPDLMLRIKSAPLSELWTSLSPDLIAAEKWKNGDHIKPIGMKGSTKISKILKDSHASFTDKQNTVVIKNKITGEILWVNGLKRSRLFLVRESDKYTYRYKIVIKT